MVNAVKRMQTMGYTDDFLKLVDNYGDEFVDAFKQNGDEANGYKNILNRGDISVKPSQEGLEVIKNHLSGDLEAEFNNAMIDRVSEALDNGEELIGPDAEFYLHELEETRLMEQGLDYVNAHNSALE